MPCYKSKFKKKTDAYGFKKIMDKYDISLTNNVHKKKDGYYLTSKPKKKKKR